MAKKKADKDTFIRTFVNQMYGILIGIGIGSILFDSAFDIGNWFNIAMVIVVTVMLVFYWWDWMEYIEGEIVSSKSEIIADFLVLIALELLFVFYNEPTSLALVLIALAICDLIWVMNHILYMKKERKGYQSGASNIRWIAEKLAGIAIYATLYLVFVFLHPLVPTFVQNVTTVILVILAFTAVRRLSFNEVFKARAYKTRWADDKDSVAIAAINNDYIDDDHPALIQRLTVRDVLERIRKKEIIVAQNSKKNIVGYALVSNRGAKPYLPDTQFPDQKLRDKMMSGPHILLEQIAVKVDCRREGIGGILLKAVLDRIDETLLSYVAISPVDNVESTAFHEHHGFMPVGTFRRDVFAGRNDYRSTLYCISKDR